MQVLVSKVFWLQHDEPKSFLISNTNPLFDQIEATQHQGDVNEENCITQDEEQHVTHDGLAADLAKTALTK